MFSFRLMLAHLARVQYRRTTNAVRFQLADLGFRRECHVPANLVDMVLHKGESDEYIIAACLAIQQIGE